jgi:acyl carrier protein
VSESIEKGIIEIVADIAGVEPDEIKPETNFAQDLEIDSIKAIEITVAIEKKFKVSVRDEDVPKILTLHQAVDLVTKLLEQKGLLHG